MSTSYLPFTHMYQKFLGFMALNLQDLRIISVVKAENVMPISRYCLNFVKDLTASKESNENILMIKFGQTDDALKILLPTHLNGEDLSNILIQEYQKVTGTSLKPFFSSEVTEHVIRPSVLHGHVFYIPQSRLDKSNLSNILFPKYDAEAFFGRKETDQFVFFNENIGIDEYGHPHPLPVKEYQNLLRQSECALDRFVHASIFIKETGRMVKGHLSLDLLIGFCYPHFSSSLTTEADVDMPIIPLFNHFHKYPFDIAYAATLKKSDLEKIAPAIFSADQTAGAGCYLPTSFRNFSKTEMPEWLRADLTPQITNTETNFSSDQPKTIKPQL